MSAATNATPVKSQGAKQSHARVIVVGGGLAGLMTTIRACEAGLEVDLFSVVPVKRSHSVCAQGGINGAVNTKGEGDSPWEHFDDTIYGGDFLANQPPVKAMCEAAPGIIYLLDRMGVPFSRTPEGLLDFRRFGGTKHHRTAFAGASTGQQLMYALDEQVRKFEVAGKVRKFEGWEFLRLVREGDGGAGSGSSGAAGATSATGATGASGAVGAPGASDAGCGDGFVGATASDGPCRGIVAMNLETMEVRAFPAGAVAMATGGPGMIFGRSTNSLINTGAAAAICYLQGAKYANGEFIQVHPTAMPGEDKLRLMSESARGEGGRVWVYRDGKPWYFLEDMYPAYGNLVPRDIATRAIHKVVYDMGLGINGQPVVYLDVTHIPQDVARRKLGAILDIYEKFMGEDPTKVPMKVFPGVHYSMGGLWVDYEQMTNIPGLFAVGECDYSIHGANRLGANSLLSCIYAGTVAGPAMARYCKGVRKAVSDLPSSTFERAQCAASDEIAAIRKMDGGENVYKLGAELGEWMTKNVTVTRYNRALDETDEHIQKLQDRWSRIGIQDRGDWANQNVQQIRQLRVMMELARVVTIGARMRDESRGAHYKPDFPERDDARFLRTTIAEYVPAGGAGGTPSAGSSASGGVHAGPRGAGPKFSYEAVDVSLIKPRPRKYDVDKSNG